MALPRDDLADAKVTTTCLSSVPVEAPFSCVVAVSGLGDAPPALSVVVRLPPSILHVGHDARGRFDADARTLTFRVTPQTGAPAFHYELVADQSAAGYVSTIRATLRAEDQLEGTERQASTPVAVDRQSRVDLGYAIVPVAPIWVFLAMVLSLPLCAGVVWTLRRGRRALARAPRRPGFLPVPRDRVMAPAIGSLVCVLALLLLSPAP